MSLAQSEQLLVLGGSEGLHFGESDSLREESLDGGFDHFLLVEAQIGAFGGLALLLVG